MCIQTAGVNEFILCPGEMHSRPRVAKIIGQVISKRSWLAPQTGVNLLDALEGSAVQMRREAFEKPWARPGRKAWLLLIKTTMLRRSLVTPAL